MEHSKIIDITWESVPDTQPDDGDPMVFVVVTGMWPRGDIGGLLMDHRGVPMHSHISSSMSWLRQDLTNGFPNRAHALAERYGPTVRGALVENWDQAPTWLVEANNAWAVKQTPSSPDREEASTRG